MDSPQLHAIGFDAPTVEEIITKAFEAGVRGINSAPGFAMIGTYTDPSGARLAFLQREGESVNTTAGLVAETTYRAQVVRFTDLLARVALYSDEGEGQLLTQYLQLFYSSRTINIGSNKQRPLALFFQHYAQLADRRCFSCALQTYHHYYCRRIRCNIYAAY